MSTYKVQCFQCGEVAEFSDPPGFKEECEKCRADLHVCKCCRFYDPGSYNECREPSADVVRDKERANFCEYYEGHVPGQKPGPSKDDLLSAAEALFKKK